MDTADLLAHLSGFRTLEGHQQELIRRGWQDDGRGFIVEVLKELKDRGLLLSRSEFLAGIGRAIPEGGSVGGISSGISTIAWVSRDRPAVLQRSLESLLSNLRGSGRTTDIALFDDSADDCSRTVLHRFGRQAGLRTLYCGKTEKSAFLDRFFEGSRERLPGREILEFALLGQSDLDWTPGANHNAQLLGTAGEMILSSDDDIMFRIAESLREEEGVEICSVADPTEIAFFPNERTLLDSLREIPVDWLAVHERCLGRSAFECTGSDADPASLHLDRLASALIATLSTAQGRVLLTLPGLYGDTAFRGASYLLSLDGMSRQNLVTGRDEYKSAFESRTIFRGVNRLTVTDGGFFVAGHFGLDNRGLLPPFFPVQRLEDGVFIQTLKASRRDALQAYLPRSVLHSPDPPRSYHPDSRFEAAPRFPELVMLLFGSFRMNRQPDDPAAGLIALGRFLQEAASLADASFASLSAELWVRFWSVRIGYLESLLERHRGPAYWARDVERLIDTLREHVTGPDPTVPADLLATGRTPEQAMHLARELIGKFGELLQGWPAIVERARELKAEGRGLAVPLE